MKKNILAVAILSFISVLFMACPSLSANKYASFINNTENSITLLSLENAIEENLPAEIKSKSSFIITPVDGKNPEGMTFKVEYNNKIYSGTTPYCDVSDHDIEISFSEENSELVCSFKSTVLSSSNSVINLMKIN